MRKLSRTPSGRKKTIEPVPIDLSRYAVTIPFEALESQLDFLRDNSLHVEIMMYDTSWIRTYPHDQVKAMGERLEREGIGVSVHGPLFDLNPGSQDRIIRDYTEFNFMRCLNISALLKASIVVFHLGLNPLVPEDYREMWLKTSMKTWKPVVSHARRLGIAIAIENMFLSTPNLLRKVVDIVDSPNMQICLDIGHLNVYSTVPIEDWLDLLAEKIVKVHINDNDAKNDLHLAFGEGNMNFPEIYRLLEKHRVRALMTLEMTPQKLPPTFDYLKEYGLTLPSS